jgi:hypothetical protein
VPNYNEFNPNYRANSFVPEEVRRGNYRRDQGGQIFQTPAAMQPLVNRSQMESAILRAQPQPVQPVQPAQSRQVTRQGRGIIGLGQYAYNKFKNRGT